MRHRRRESRWSCWFAASAVFVPEFRASATTSRSRASSGVFSNIPGSFYFRNGGAEEIYLGSADLMNRNLNRRVETLFPLEERGLVDHVRNGMLSIYLADNVKARRMNSDGSYKLVPSSGEPLNAQEWFLEQAKALKKTR